MKPGQLRRDTQKAREWTQRGRGSLSARSPHKGAQAAKEKVIRQRVFERDGGCFLAVLDPTHRCLGPLTPHHRRKAGAGGAYTEANLVTICQYGNGDIEERPAYYRERFPYLVVREGDEEWETLGRRAAR